MTVQTNAATGLTGNQLKLIALVAMTCDHIGAYFFPESLILRIIGRLAFPIFAYMIAEGCRHTASKSRYLTTVISVAMLCQIVSFCATGSMHQRILVTFALSIGLIYALEIALRYKSGGIAALAFVIVWLISVVLPRLLPGFDIEYGFFGILLPVLVWFGKNKKQSLILCGVGLALLSLGGIVQAAAFLALPLLAIYNGTRGKANIKYLFYIYYPAHLALIYIAQQMIS